MALVVLLSACGKITKTESENGSTDQPPVYNNLIIDHTCTSLNAIPGTWITTAKTNLHIAYGHTSHGSQLIDGMTGLLSFKPGFNTLYDFNNGGSGGALDLRDELGNYGMPYGAADLNQPNYTEWASATRTYLSGHPGINVIIWSWCGGVSHATTTDIDNYLSLMNQLEIDYPSVKFVYMTGHTDGTGLSGTLHLQNERIRTYCRNNKKILYDFEDIESYDPDNNYFGDKFVDDACNYSGGGNWATEWQSTHPGEWYSCGAAHSQPLNANRKAYAVWWLWARLAGWDGN